MERKPRKGNPRYVVEEIEAVWEISVKSIRRDFEFVSDMFEAVLAEKVALGYRLHSFTHAKQVVRYGSVFDKIVAVFELEA